MLNNIKSFNAINLVLLLNIGQYFKNINMFLFNGFERDHCFKDTYLIQPHCKGWAP